MKNLVGEFLFGIGIAILGGAIVLMWDKLSSYNLLCFGIDCWGFYIGILIVGGIILLLFGARYIKNRGEIKELRRK